MRKPISEGYSGTIQGEIIHVTKAFFRMGKYLGVLFGSVALGMYCMNKLTPSVDDIRKQYSDPVSRQLIEENMSQENRLRKRLFQQAGIIPSDEELKKA